MTQCHEQPRHRRTAKRKITANRRDRHRVLGSHCWRAEHSVLKASTLGGQCRLAPVDPRSMSRLSCTTTVERIETGSKLVSRPATFAPLDNFCWAAERY